MCCQLHHKRTHLTFQSWIINVPWIIHMLLIHDWNNTAMSDYIHLSIGKFSQSLSFPRWLKLAVRKFAPPSPTFDPMTSASWDLYLETLNFPTLTVMVNQLKWWGLSSLKTKPTRSPRLRSLSYLLLPNALTSMQEPSSLSLSSSSMLSTGRSICEKGLSGNNICILIHTDELIFILNWTGKKKNIYANSYTELHTGKRNRATQAAGPWEYL